MKERYLLEDVGDNNGFSLITDYDGNDEQAFEVNVKSGEILPVLPLRNMVLFPGVFLPITVGRKSSLKLIRDAEKKNKDTDDVKTGQDMLSADSKNLFEAFLNGDIDAYCENEAGSGFDTVPIKSFDVDGGEWDSYSVYGYLDVDNDGEDELILKGPYGACFFDAKDDKVTLFARGEGTGIPACSVSFCRNADCYLDRRLKN